MLGWIGHHERYLLDGGLAGWLAAELPLEAGETLREPQDYGSVEATDAGVATTAEIAQWSTVTEAASARLLDARAPARFAGASEPIDPVAGHVPGARNLPFTELLNADGRFRAPAELRQIFTGVVAPQSPADGVIAMCGSGVTACHLLAGLAVAGYSGRLYVGSWSEWIRDPARAVATAT